MICPGRSKRTGLLQVNRTAPVLFINDRQAEGSKSDVEQRMRANDDVDLARVDGSFDLFPDLSLQGHAR